MDECDTESSADCDSGSSGDGGAVGKASHIDSQCNYQVRNVSCRTSQHKQGYVEDLRSHFFSSPAKLHRRHLQVLPHEHIPERSQPRAHHVQVLRGRHTKVPQGVRQRRDQQGKTRKIHLQRCRSLFLPTRFRLIKTTSWIVTMSSVASSPKAWRREAPEEGGRDKSQPGT